jgi:uncharacterized protein involved in outer membrane biogenesis
MGKFLKILLIIIGVIVIIIIAGYFAIRAYLTPALVRNVAQKVASEAIHRPVEIGKVGLSFGFRVGISINDVSVANSGGFTPGPMIQVDKTKLNLKILPLLRREIVIGGLDFSGIKLEIERNKKGELNFATLIPKMKKGTGWSFSLSSVNISKADIHYTDKKNNTEIKVKDLDQKFRFRGNKVITSGKNTIYILKNKTIPEMIVKTGNNIEYDTLKKNIQIKKLTASYDPIRFDVSGTIEKMETMNLSAVLNIDDMSKMKSLIPINSRPNELKGTLKSNFSVLGTMKTPKIDGRCELKNITVVPKGMNRGVEKIQGSLSFDEHAIRNIILQGKIGDTRLNVTGSVTNLKEAIFNLTAKVDGNLHDFGSIIDEMKNISMKGPVIVNVTIKGKAKNPSYYGEYSIRNAEIDGIGLTKPITNFQVKGSIQHNAAKISRCSGHIGRSDFSFDGHISNFKKPVIQINNISNTIDLDELLPKQEKKAGTEKQGTKGVPITLNGNVRINTLTGMDMVYKNVNTNFTFENGVIDLQNCSADAFDGKVKFDFYYNSNNPEPYRITTRMYSISAKKILKRFLKFENLEGKLSGMSNFKGNGFTAKDVLSNLNAAGNLKLNNGVFKNFKVLTGLLAWLGMKDYKNVKFDDLAIYFKITNGKADIKDWVLSSSFGNFLTNGTIGLNGNLNLKVTTTLSKKYSNIVKKYHGDWIFPIDKKGRAIIDLIIKGKLASPKFSLDKNKIKKRIKGKIKDDFNKKKKEWEKKLKELLKGK